MSPISRVWWLSVLFFVAAVVTRVWQLDALPAAFSHDEMGYLINAQSVAANGLSRTGNWRVFDMRPVEPSLAELPTAFLVPFFKLPLNPMIQGRALSVLMSLSLPFFVASISYSLFRSRPAAWLSWVLALFNPWIWQNGRLFFDIPVSLWWYTLGMALFLRTQSAWRLLALVPFWLGFYSYQGFKLILPGVGLILALYAWWETNRFRWQPKKIWPSLTLALCTMLLFGLYGVFQFAGQMTSQSRLNQQLLTPSSEVVTTAVNTDRRLALLTPFNELFINKYTQTFKEIMKRYVLVFGGQALFFEISAHNSSFAVWNHGMFYLLDAVLIVIGLMALVLKKRRAQLWCLGLLALVSIWPVAVNQSIWLYFRPSFLFPLLLVVAGVGLESVLAGRRWVAGVVIALYSISIVHFGFLYFVRYPVYGAENIFFSPRILAAYLHRLPETQKVVVFEKEPEFVFTSFVYYYQLFTPQRAAVLQSQYQTGQYQLNAIQFASCVPADLPLAADTTYVVDNDVPDCQPTDKRLFTTATEGTPPPTFIRSVKDNGVDYTLYNQTLCSDPAALNHFVHPQTLRHFRLDQLSTAEFCDTWITREPPEVP